MSHQTHLTEADTIFHDLSQAGPVPKKWTQYYVSGVQMARKIYAQEFKEQAVKLSYSNDKSVAMTAADLGLPPNMLHRWRREAKLTGRAFPGYGKARDEELAELKKRLKQAELERDILKKAISFFAAMPK
jgi:transposase